jgi:hypothetical protein
MQGDVDHAGEPPVLMFKVDAVPVGVLPVAQIGTLLSG